MCVCVGGVMEVGKEVDYIPIATLSPPKIRFLFLFLFGGVSLLV